MMYGALATGDTLRRRHISRYSHCHICCQETETTSRLFFYCEYAQATWRASGIPNPIMFDATTTMDTKLEAILQCNTSSRTRQFQQLPL